MFPRHLYTNEEKYSSSITKTEPNSTVDVYVTNSSVIVGMELIEIKLIGNLRFKSWKVFPGMLHP